MPKVVLSSAISSLQQYKRIFLSLALAAIFCSEAEHAGHMHN
jgi:hypothetical protein